MIKALFTSTLARLKADYLVQVAESNVAKDELLEFVVIPEAKEECATCVEDQQLIDWIDAQEVDRDVDTIYIHCSGTRITATVTAILNYAKNTLKWKNPPYHIIITHDKGFTVCADLQVVCNGVRGKNAGSIQISTIGGVDTNGKHVDTRSASQIRLSHVAVKALKNKFPKAKVKGHRDAPAAKSCPCFDAIPEFSKY